MFKSKANMSQYRKPKKNIFTLIRLRRICRALGIKRLYKWQIDYVFNKSRTIVGGRASGKTIAFIIKLLMWRIAPFRKNEHLGSLLRDPDYSKARIWTDREVYKAHAKCKAKHIKVFEII